METNRLKIKIGEHEFEAEGPAEIVQRQFDTFKELIASQPKQINTTTRAATQAGNSELDSILRVDGRVVSLTVRPQSEGTAAMLVMLGQKSYRENETVTASEIKDGLEQSGYRPTRIDRIMQPFCDAGDVIRIGARKGTRYRFTNQGVAKAYAAAKEAREEVKM